VQEDFKLLLGLYHFFELAHGDAPQRPRAVNDHLPSLMILPRSGSDADMASALGRLDEMMRRSDAVLRGEHLRHLLLDAMRCRLALHHGYRNSGGMASPGFGGGYQPEVRRRPREILLVRTHAHCILNTTHRPTTTRSRLACSSYSPTGSNQTTSRAIL
jgi:hypothetical protein